MEKGETPEQFVERLRHFMRKWREMAGYNTNKNAYSHPLFGDVGFFTSKVGQTNLVFSL